MKIYKSCPVCNSENLIGDSIDLFRKGPHISRTKCLDCELIFANPMAESKELEEYYLFALEEKNKYKENEDHTMTGRNSSNSIRREFDQIPIENGPLLTNQNQTNSIGRGRGRGINNLPAWMLEQQKEKEQNL